MTFVQFLTMASVVISGLLSGDNSPLADGCLYIHQSQIPYLECHRICKLGSSALTTGLFSSSLDAKMASSWLVAMTHVPSNKISKRSAG